MSKEGRNLTEKEMRLLALSWMCFHTEPQVDFDKLAGLTGYTLGSTKVLLGNLKRKLKSVASENLNGDEDDKKPVTPKPSPRKRKPQSTDDGVPSSVSKRGKTTRRGSANRKGVKKALADVAEESGKDADEGPVVSGDENVKSDE
ncbi:hypothetical protein EJ06DRAFT_554363 [Trichodelitschia bisporula]|uniref:Uncharacterized protein n=1 Tax=Trichodelitschia bisporula TaxID=703511 RepID=A0A6G1I3T3_9PEZI|nr:hypothetical protein EJ06DRAFT_554363 [Trichodelitschia bisporula]